jgi:hypothetical protein
MSTNPSTPLSTIPEKDSLPPFRTRSSSFSETLSPHDPLLWPRRKKYVVLASMCYITFLTDFLAGYGVPMTVPQARDWKISVIDAGRSLSGNTFVSLFDLG